MTGKQTIHAVIPVLCAFILSAPQAATHEGPLDTHNDKFGESTATDSLRHNGSGKNARQTEANDKNASGRPRSQQQVRLDMRASQLLGKEVRNREGESLGEIKDFYVDLQAGRAPYAVLSPGGVLGSSDKLHPFPITAFKLSSDRGELVLNVDKEKLKSMPGFDGATWPDYSGQVGLFAQVDRFFGNESNRAPVRKSSNRGLMRASELLGRNVNDRNGQDIGEIQEAVIDVSRGRISYVVLDFDKRWSLDDKLLPMPLKAFALPNKHGGPFVFKLDRERLDMARGFERNKWPDLNSSAQRATTEDYFLALERPTQRESAAGGKTMVTPGGDAGVSGGIYADPVTGASVPGENEKADRPQTKSK